MPRSGNEGLVYWLLTHFTVFDYRFDDADWYYRYFEDKLMRYRSHGVTLDLYSQVETWDRAASGILDTIKSAFKEHEAAWRSERRRARRLSSKVGRWIADIGHNLECWGMGRN